MIRHLSFLSALCLLSFITLKAHASPTTYRSSWNFELDNASTLSGSWDWNDLAGNASSLMSGKSLLCNAEDGQIHLLSAVLPPCEEVNNEGFESSFGIWIDGGSNCARSNSFPNTGSWSVELRGGPASEMSTPPQNFTGVGVTLSISFYPQGFETGEGLLLEYATNSAGSYSVFTAWIAGNNLVNDTRYNVTVPMNSVTWTINSKLRLRSLANATNDKVYIDDVVISNCCDVGAPCNDNSQCTTGDVINANCQCAGTYQDADGDGTCDAFDICPGLDDYLVISEVPCDDGDPCTVGDHLDSDICGCQGQYIDWDQDGYCQSEDPNDVDACIPDPENPACNPCTTHEYSHFESNFQIWNSGGNDCSRVYAPQHAYAGNYCVRIQDNSGAQSSMYTDNINLAGLDNVSVTFFFKAVGMEVNEDFLLEYSTNAGGSYTVVDSWSRGTDFENNAMQYRIVPVTGVTWTSQSRFRFRCDASANDDQVYIDDVYIKSCLNFPAMKAHIEIVEPTASNDGPGFFNAGFNNVHEEELMLSPNPVSTELHLSGMSLEEATIDVFDIMGSQMRNISLDKNTLDVSYLLPGLYFVRIEINGQLFIKRFVKE